MPISAIPQAVETKVQPWKELLGGNTASLTGSLYGSCANAHRMEKAWMQEEEVDEAHGHTIATSGNGNSHSDT